MMSEQLMTSEPLEIVEEVETDNDTLSPQQLVGATAIYCTGCPLIALCPKAGTNNCLPDDTEKEPGRQEPDDEPEPELEPEPEPVVIKKTTPPPKSKNTPLPVTRP